MIQVNLWERASDYDPTHLYRNNYIEWRGEFEFVQLFLEHGAILTLGSGTPALDFHVEGMTCRIANGTLHVRGAKPWRPTVREAD